MLPISEVSSFKRMLRLAIELAREEDNPKLQSFMVGGFIVSGYILNPQKFNEEYEASKSSVELDIEAAEQAENISKLQEIFYPEQPGVFVSENSSDTILLRDVTITLGNGETINTKLWKGRIDHISAVWQTSEFPSLTEDDEDDF